MPFSPYPLFLNLEGKPCLVIGGGKVAVRKVKDLLASGAKVTVVSADVADELSVLTDRVEFKKRDYRQGDEKGQTLVFVTTDKPDVNQQATANAKAAGALVNVADAPADCDFYVPSKIDRGDLMIALCTSGKAPALTRALRIELEKQFGEEYAVYVALLGWARERVRRLPGLDAKTRGEMMRKLLELDLMPLIKQGQEDIAREEVEAWISRWSA